MNIFPSTFRSQSNQFIGALSLLVFVISLGVRGVSINAPPYDAHPMRQSDTACVIHFFHEDPNILYPKACLIRPPTNYPGYFFLELPLYQWGIAMFQRIISSTDWWTVRVINLILYSLAYWNLFFGSRKMFNARIAFFAVTIFSFMPSSLFFFGQAIHPDIFMITTLFSAWNAVGAYISTKRSIYIVSCIFLLNLSIATRPFVAISVLPFAYILWLHRQYKGVLAILISPFLLYGCWILWQKQFPVSDHAWEMWVFQGRELLLKTEVLKNLVMKNFIGEVTGKMVGFLAGLGFVHVLFSRRKNYMFLILWTCMIPLYWLIVPAGNISHQYYSHVVLIPIILLSSLCIERIFTMNIRPIIRLPLICLIILLIGYNGYRTSRYFFITRVSPEERALAKVIQTIVPKGQKIVYLGKTSIPLSLSYHQGWTIESPGADLYPNATSVQRVFSYARYIVDPAFDDSFPSEETKKLQTHLNIISQSSYGTIYVVK